MTEGRGLAEALRGHARAPDSGGYRPALFDASDPVQRQAVVSLLDTNLVQFVHDTIDEQLTELAASRAPWRRSTREEAAAEVRAIRGGRPSEEYGTWVHYPWSRRLVHVLPVAELRELRTNRNRYKITAEEQARLAVARIGVVGLSVGNMAALTCALEGVGTRFRLADFDELSLSNLNRLRGGVQDLALPKPVLAAREMFELDPYLDIEIFPQGVTPENLEAFLLGATGAERLDLLVEECDDLYVKVRIRERARAARIPVVMDTSDRGMLDVERFDLTPDRPILHGLLGDVDADSLRGLETRDKAPYVLAILGAHKMSTRMAASLPEVKQSVASWPQLASSVALGGALVADVARRIVLDTHRESGRWYVDLDALLGGPPSELAEPAAPPAPAEIAPEALSAPVLPREPSPEEARALGDDVARWLVAQATLAPSAHNAQPWRFRWSDGALACEHDPSRDLPTMDFEHGATWVAFGALLENLSLAAAAVGLEARAESFPDAREPGLVLRVRFEPCAVRRDPLFDWIPVRVTNRRCGPRAPLGDAGSRLCAVAEAVPGARLQLVTSAESLDEMGALVGACDRLAAFHEAMHEETMEGLRWTRAEVEAHRDGLDVVTMELPAADRAGLALLSSWPIARALAELGGGRALEDTGRRAIASASAVGLLTMPGTTRESYLAGGRVLQRVWLDAASEGLAVQPVASLPYLFARLERGGGAGLSEAQRASLADLRARYARVLEVEPDRAEVLLFRVARAAPPTARSLRRRLEDVLDFSPRGT
ncbi:MAG TPA: Rv1355c family protein [Gaiellaceae bacterium]|nr:Rv1355c family protein [Gaiellaceae bacterium]